MRNAWQRVSYPLSHEGRVDRAAWSLLTTYAYDPRLLCRAGVMLCADEARVPLSILGKVLDCIETEYRKDIQEEWDSCTPDEKEELVAMYLFARALEKIRGAENESYLVKSQLPADIYAQYIHTMHCAIEANMPSDDYDYLGKAEEAEFPDLAKISKPRIEIAIGQVINFFRTELESLKSEQVPSCD